MKVPLELKNSSFFSTPKRVLFRLTLNLGGAFQLDHFLHYCVCAQMAAITVSFHYTYLRFCMLWLRLVKPLRAITVHVHGRLLHYDMHIYIQLGKATPI